MGCDIHICTEIKKVVEGTEEWFNADNWKFNPYFKEDEEEGELEYEIKSIYNNRGYNLFALLAGVRNYSEVVPIDEPRGIPKDVHSVTKREYESWGLDGHTPSWFTLEELKQAKKDNPTTQYSGMVSPEGMAAIENGDMPDMWCQDTNIPDYKYVEWAHEHTLFDQLIEQLELIKRDGFLLFGDEEHPELDCKVRMVFWFDN